MGLWSLTKSARIVVAYDAFLYRFRDSKDSTLLTGSAAPRLSDLGLSQGIDGAWHFVPDGTLPRCQEVRLPLVRPFKNQPDLTGRQASPHHAPVSN